MSVKGVRQLKELLIRYSDYDGSSKGVVRWMNQHLVDFATVNPQLSVITSVKRAKHPVVRGTYVNGNVKTICVKNATPEEVAEQVFHLRNQVGLKVNGHYKKPVISRNPSIQGQWHERLNMSELKIELL